MAEKRTLPVKETKPMAAASYVFGAEQTEGRKGAVTRGVRKF